jgi:hypothetical protein
MKTTTKAWIALGVMTLLSPLGLLLPEHFKAGAAWGEWGADEMEKLVGYVPEGLKKLSEIWKAPIPDYAFQGWEEKGLTHLGAAYIFSGLLGAALVVLLTWWLGKKLSKKD